MSIVILFGVALAEGSHLFPFRTEKLSPPAPMVLPGKPGGRVGRRPIFLRSPGPWRGIGASVFPPVSTEPGGGLAAPGQARAQGRTAASMFWSSEAPHQHSAAPESIGDTAYSRPGRPPA